MAGLGEAAHLVEGDALLDVLEDLLVAALVADQEQAQAAVLEQLDRVVVEVGAAVAAPGQAERGELLGDLAGARQVGGEGVVVEEELAHLREELLHVGHFVGDVLRGADAVFVPADGLRPEAEGALGRAAAAGVEAHVGMEQVADEILLDLQVALIDVGHPGQRVHVGDHLALGVVLDLAVLVAVAQAGDGVERAAFGDFLAGEIEFLAPDPVNGRGGLQRLGRQHRGVRADEADLGLGPVLLDGFGDFAVVLQRGRAGVDDDVVVALGLFEALLDARCRAAGNPAASSWARARRVAPARSDTRSW